MVNFGQYLDVLLASFLIVRLLRLGLQAEYKAFLVFVAYDTIQSLVFIFYRAAYNNGFDRLDYRVLWCVMQVLSWVTTIWMVYALLLALLKRLPGIRRFSLRLLNIVFGLSILVGVLTIRPELVADNWVHRGSWVAKVTLLVGVVRRSLFFSELLVLLLTLTFLLCFPIRVPRNLAVFSVGLSIYLFFNISLQLIRSYVVGWDRTTFAAVAPPFLSACCLIYWIVSLNSAGEEAGATLGRTWQTVPKEHLVRQLEAINAALLRSREQL